MENKFTIYDCLFTGLCIGLVLALFIGWLVCLTGWSKADNEIKEIKLQLKESNAQKNALLHALSPMYYQPIEEE